MLCFTNTYLYLVLDIRFRLFPTDNLIIHKDQWSEINKPTTRTQGYYKSKKSNSFNSFNYIVLN